MINDIQIYCLSTFFNVNYMVFVYILGMHKNIYFVDNNN